MNPAPADLSAERIFLFAVSLMNQVSALRGFWNAVMSPASWSLAWKTRLIDFTYGWTSAGAFVPTGDAE